MEARRLSGHHSAMDGKDPRDWQSHKGLVRLWASRVMPRVEHLGVQYHDLVQEGERVLFECMKPGRFNPDLGYEPSTYVMRALIKRTDRTVAAAAGFATEKRHARHLTIPTHPIRDTNVDRDFRRDTVSDGNGLVDEMDEILFFIQMAQLTDEEIVAIGMWMRGRSHKQVAQVVCVTVDRASRLIASAKKKLRETCQIIHPDPCDSANEDAVVVQSPDEKPAPGRPMEAIVLKVTDRGVR